MPEKQTLKRAQRDKARGKAPTTQAGEFVREEIHHVREGKHGARSPQQVIAIGLSKARKAGVNLPPPKEGTTSTKTRRSAARAYKQGRSGSTRTPSKRRSRATRSALKREGHKAGTTKALSRQGRSAAARRSSSDRSAAARKGARTKGNKARSSAARRAARTRTKRG
jgi:hypothetical protein